MKENDDIQRLPDVQEDFYGVGIPGLTAKLIKRTDKKAIYLRWDDAYEVFRIKIAEASDVFGKSYPRREIYPGNEDFGSTAWCYKDREMAMRRYDAL